MRNTNYRFGGVAKLFHWSIVLLLICSYVFEQFMHGLSDGALKWQFYDLHKSVGITVLFITIMRMIWRAFNPPPALPTSMSGMQKMAAKTSHKLLYLCVLVMPISGFIGSKAGGYNAFWFGTFEMPDLFGKNKLINQWAELTHMVTAYVLLAIIVVHILAAFYHQFYLRDGLMMRMLIWGDRKPDVDTKTLSDQEKRVFLRKPVGSGSSKGREKAYAWAAFLLLFGGAIPAAVWSVNMISANGNLLFVLAINLAYAGAFTILMLVLSYLQLCAKKPILDKALPHKTVTLTMAAHNERDVIVDALNAALKQSRELDQIIVVNDGSTDGTFGVLQDSFALELVAKPQGLYQSTSFPNLCVIDKAHAGKAAALNAALELTHTDIFITVDADSILAKDAIANMVNGMAVNPKVVAAGGMVKAINGFWGAARNGDYVGLPSGVLAKLQWVEYATGFVWRFGWAKLNIQLLLSGSFSGFQTRILRAVGGFDPTSLTEDYEVCYRLHAYCRQQGIDYAIITLSDALCYTLVPDNLLDYLRQRIRWFQGFLQTLWRYRRYILRPSYGWFGVFALPIKVIDALSPLLALVAGTLIAMAWFDCNSMVLVPAALFLGARWLIEFVYATLLLSLHHVFIQSDLRLADKFRAYLLGPVNFMYHTFVWYIYGVVAHIRLWFGVWSWSKNRAIVQSETDPEER